MLQIIRMGENSCHDQNFVVDRPNGHPVALLLLIKTPSEFYIDGRFQIVPANVAVLFAPGQKHLYRAAPEQVSPSPSDSNIAYVDCWMHLESPGALAGEHFPYGIPINLHQPEDFYQLFHLINNEYLGSSPQRNQILNGLSSALIQKVIAEHDTSEYPSIYYELSALREKIYATPARNWNVTEMAQELHLSLGYFQALYKQYFDTSCIRDVIKSRLQSACELLIFSDHSVEEISLLTGYHNTEHFIRQFKSQLNLTPAKYRRTFR